MRIHPKQRIRELAIDPGRLAKAYLAETYDGIGQYVKVTMSRNAVTAALLGRVAAGDFGGGRTFPEGTPVVVSSYRGQLEVLLGNIPGSCVDEFQRLVGPGTNLGWGKGDLGTWTLAGSSGPNPQSGVDGENAFTGAATSGSSFRQFCRLDGSIANLGIPPIQVLVDATIKNPGTVAGASQDAQVEIDWENTGEAWGSLYVVVAASRLSSGVLNFWRISIQTTDADFNTIDFPIVNLDVSLLGQPIKVRVLVEDTTTKARVWLATAPEPDVWDITLTYSSYTFLSLIPSARFGVGLSSPQAGRTLLDRVEIVDCKS